LVSAKAWRLQEVAGEGDSVRWRNRQDSLADSLQESVKARRGAVGMNLNVDDDFFTEAKEDGYSMTDDDLGAALSGRLSELASGVVSPKVF
jgi:hypothetical protein